VALERSRLEEERLRLEAHEEAMRYEMAERESQMREQQQVINQQLAGERVPSQTDSNSQSSGDTRPEVNAEGQQVWEQIKTKARSSRQQYQKLREATAEIRELNEQLALYGTSPDHLHAELIASRRQAAELQDAL